MGSIGDRLREERDRLGHNQTVFGAIGGVQKQAQLKYEKGERFPGADYLAAIARVGADVQYIVTGERCPGSLSTDETELLERFRAAPLAVKAAALAGLQAGAQPDVNKDRQGSKTQIITGSGNRVAGRDYHGKE